VQKESVTKVITSKLSRKKSVLPHSIRFVNRLCKVQFRVGNSEVNITKLNANMIKPIVGITNHITSKPDVELGKSKMQREYSMVLTLVFGCTSHTKSDMELMMCQLDVQLNGLNLEVWSLPNYIFLFGAVSSLREATLAFGMLFICNLRAI
jgi:hypothetical protein